MRKFSSDGLTTWLRETQNYATSTDALHRISGSVDGLNSALQALDTDTLFWTEPAHLDVVFDQGKPATGSTDE